MDVGKDGQAQLFANLTQHGQTVPVDKPFSWKHKKGGAWVVTTYMHPPNRPNDRETLVFLPAASTEVTRRVNRS